MCFICVGYLGSFSHSLVWCFIISKVDIWSVLYLTRGILKQTTDQFLPLFLWIVNDFTGSECLEEQSSVGTYTSPKCASSCAGCLLPATLSVRALSAKHVGAYIPLTLQKGSVKSCPLSTLHSWVTVPWKQKGKSTLPYLVSWKNNTNEIRDDSSHVNLHILVHW